MIEHAAHPEVDARAASAATRPRPMRRWRARRRSSRPPTSSRTTRHAPLGAYVAVADVKRDGSITVWSQSSQSQGARANIAHIAGRAVREGHDQVAAGSRTVRPHALTAATARWPTRPSCRSCVGKPVRVQWTLAEDLTWSTRRRLVCGRQGRPRRERQHGGVQERLVLAARERRAHARRDPRRACRRSTPGFDGATYGAISTVWPYQTRRWRSSRPSSWRTSATTPPAAACAATSCARRAAPAEHGARGDHHRGRGGRRRGPDRSSASATRPISAHRRPRRPPQARTAGQPRPSPNPAAQPRRLDARQGPRRRRRDPQRRAVGRRSPTWKSRRAPASSS